ncbi:ABC transporter substrate-binding protein [Parachitinimonas caeni]|uniref:ABC transporter substrate-binding protein n=1 Tax=Parachitinimonas caeni TaxID=3031301 RepID=A0ABT7E332_9NEIS|nr:ABC transporter substrate-binding protein [Parachitinimonas caeni]MDK2125800.1 ABC transporter substrate-binding protein [Parachitinimonas caeni]
MIRQLIARTAICTACSLGIAHADIVVGQSTPLSGAVGDMGKGLMAGARAYIEAVNAKGGISGEKLRLVTLDDQYKPDNTVTNTHTLLEKENALILTSYLGTATTGELLKSKLLDTNKVALVGTLTGASNLRESPSNVFHLRASYADEIVRIVDILKGMGLVDVAVYHESGVFGMGGKEALEKALTTNKMPLVDAASYDNKLNDGKPAAVKLAQSRALAIVMISSLKPTVSFVREYRQAGGTAQLFHLSTVNYENLVKELGPQLAHGIGIAQIAPYFDNTRIAVIREMHDAMKKYTPETKPSYYTLEGFINTKVAVEAIRRAGGRSANRATVLKAMEEMGKVDIGGYTVDFDRRNQGSRYVELTMIGADGRLAH